MSKVPASTTPSVTIRFSRSEDAVSLTRLAALDSARPLAGSILVAERQGRLLAALSLPSGRVVADPFAPTSDLVSLLELRAATMHGEPRGRVRGSTLVRRTAAMAR